ncbi:(d)CMP kinase [Mycetocola zhujimingii]|uniref:(d)CMP kinase n=1 Tax=Mycetocola zhujimingii TaxID=2079792 RepID=UPI000D350284|nr:(d)CMP kinase [Mycetocola zhujimingii]AWB86123.1 (d)CMP kinase [Mycetocola zhujimingii]
MTKTVVAVDGPAGSGKSSVSKAAAKRLGFAFLDTGAAYRALAWHVLDSSADPEQGAAVIASLASFDYSIGTDPDGYAVHVGETDVTESIREPRVSAAVSAIARVPEVRTHLTELFRSIIRDTDKPGIIVEGRDITTVVAPDATARILLTASEEARMSRRSAELATESASDVAIALQKRDRADSRVVDFMTAADGVVTVDSTNLNFDETVDAVLDVIRTSQEK